MDRIYYRISYNGIGIYEALKKKIWISTSNPKYVWEELKNSIAFTWLKVPNTYSDKSYSYFTELGYDLFLKNTYSIFIKYLDKDKIITEKFIFDDSKINIIYQDEHQIVIEN